MKKIFLLTCICSLSLIIKAQEITENSVYSSISEFKTGEAFTLVSDVNVREKPSTQGAVVTTLPIGTAINIEKVMTDSFAVNGFKAPWCQITFDNGKKKGFLWGGFIATLVLKTQFSYFEELKDVVFLGGVGSWNDKKHEMTMQLRAAKNGKELGRIEFLTPGDLSFNCKLKEEPTGSMTNVLTALTFSTGYEACGYPWGDNLIFFTKSNKLTRVLGTTSVSDAGAFYQTEQFILPGDRGGINNHVIVTTDSAEMEDDGKDYVAKNQKYSIKIFKWTGFKLEKVK